jgi:bifunctional DNA-binding transcriptional regulator/antitoxin component of YhaV-PrlF toxin-antitoxin module
MSTKGQVVVPIRVRRQAGVRPGDVLAVEWDAADGRIALRRLEPLEEVSARVSAHIPPDTAPLTDASALYQRRRPRL